MELLDKLKMFRDELNLLIDAEEKKRAQQSQVGKRFSEKIKTMERKYGSGWIANHGARQDFKLQNEL